MGLELIIPLLFTTFGPFVVEGLKKLVGLMGKKIPPNVVPAVGTALGAGVAMAFPELGMTETMGAVAGLSGTGAHQMLKAGKYKKIT